MTDESDVPEVLWQPDPERVAETRIEDFRRWLRATRGADAADVTDYRSLWEYSTSSVADFWSAVAEYLGVRWHAEPDEVLSATTIQDARRSQRHGCLPVTPRRTGGGVTAA